MRPMLDVMRCAALAGACAVSLFATCAEAGTHTVIYSFGTGGDGTGPSAGMIDVKGSLYGTTVGGGASSAGTVFKLSAKGVEKLVYSFQNSPNDGAGPKAPVIAVGGTLYGTTQHGGSTACSGGCGTVFGATTKGVETVLYQFQGGSDGANPTAGVVNVNGTLYGTTYYGGGSSNYGTVFSITPAGVEHVLYAFKGGTDGANPMGGLINVGGTLYGTTYAGGASYYGSIFSITTAGAKTTIYSFKNSSDGAYPQSSLVKVGSTLFGTSLYGTNHLGTIYSLKPSGGSFKALYSFKGGADGATPEGNLINVNGTLYGATWSGGSTSACNGYGCGTVFSVTPSGSESVVYAFQGGNDGLNPAAGLTSVNGAIYGTTSSGGSYYNGTVFSVTP